MGKSIRTGSDIKIKLNGVEIASAQPKMFGVTVSDDIQESPHLHSRTVKYVGGNKTIELNLEQARMGYELMGVSLGRYRINSVNGVPLIEILDQDGDARELSIHQLSSTGSYCLFKDSDEDYRIAQRFIAQGDKIKSIKGKFTATNTSAQSYVCWVFNATYCSYDADSRTAEGYYDCDASNNVGQVFAMPASNGGWLDRVRVYLENGDTTNYPLIVECYKWDTNYQTSLNNGAIGRAAIPAGVYTTGAFYHATFTTPVEQMTPSANYLIHFSSKEPAATKYQIGYHSSGTINGSGYANKAAVDNDICMYIEYACRGTYVSSASYSVAGTESEQWCTFDFSNTSQSATGIPDVTYGNIYFAEFSVSAGSAADSFHQVHRNTYSNNFLGGFALRSSYKTGNPSTYWLHSTYDLTMEINFALDNHLIIEETIENYEEQTKLVTTYSGILINQLEYEYTPGEIIFDKASMKAAHMSAVRKGLSDS